MSQHPWCESDAINNLSRVAHGHVLAQKVADKLKITGTALHVGHRDYCGQGMVHENGTFSLVYVYDGYGAETKKMFASEKEFVEWLAVQSDYTMSGADDTSDLFEKDLFSRNNQRVTGRALQNYVDNN